MRAFSSSVALFLLASVCVAIYLSGLFGGFLFDDYQNIVENAMLQGAGPTLDSWLAAALSSNAGMLKRPISMLSFAISHHFFGTNPGAFKAINLIIHITNGVIIYWLCVKLIPLLTSKNEPAGAPSNYRILALLVTGIWLLHPLHVSSVLYVVQRMNLLSALFILLGLISYVSARARSLEGRPGLLLGLMVTALCLILATLSKENGVLLMAYVLVVESICFQFKRASSTDTIALWAFFGIFAAIPIILVLSYLASDPDWIVRGYNIREFTFEERILTQPRILMHYLLWTGLPLPSFMGLYHDDLAHSSGLFSPASTFISIIAIGSAVIVAIAYRKRLPALSFGILWFLVGHSLESSILALELVFEHRNYMPMLGPILGSVCLIAPRFQRLDFNFHHISVPTITSLALLAALAASTAVRASIWSDPVTLAVTSSENHPQSARSHYDAGRMLYIKGIAESNQPRAAEIAGPYFKKAAALSPTYIHPIISLMLTQHHQEEVPEDLQEELFKRIHAARLLQPTPLFLLQESISNSRVLMAESGVRRLFETAMENESLHASARAQLLNNYGRYHFVILQNQQAAVSLTIAAAEADPWNPIYRINLAKLALALEQPDVARGYIEQAQQIDVANIFDDQIREINKTIDKMFERPHAPADN